MRKKKILFFCSHNACRSQIAEALLRQLASERFDVYSAGLKPLPVHPLVRTVMKECGIDTSTQTSKSISFYIGKEVFNHVVIVCKESEADCPALHPFALNAVVRWPMNDPSAVQTNDPQDTLDAFRRTRDELEHKITEWLNDLTNQPEQGADK
jgi:arsenate reductase